ncbi:MAG: aspartate ammonia-lyase [Candidatus Aenigmarchaeota archaeon]|nr:aspartate ammonia-lyase [Candidatus Aenigmarchaeota archaeon]
MVYRIEKDAIGEVKVPKDAYYGSFVTRAQENFNLSGQKIHKELIRSLGIIKLCSAKANMKLGQLDAKRGNAIVKASQEVIDGKWDEWFVLDPFQAGAGTPNNMNANEVIANRAIELLGGEKGDYSIVNPNNHVNMAQSSNDVVPTATRIASYMLTEKAVEELSLLEKSFRKKSHEFRGIVKVGRTHLQDAVPILLSQEFDAYADTVMRSRIRIEKASKALLELGLGGTAIGTGITAHPKYHSEAIKNIASHTGKKFYPTKNRVHMTQSMDSFTEASSSLRNFAIEFIKVIDDLMVLNSGPKAGFGEISLPDVEPGSSIMPGKVNPSIAEAMKFVCLQVIGCECAIAEAAREGNHQLSIMAPIIGFNYFFICDLLANGSKMMRTFCVNGIVANKGRIKELFESSLVTATALSPYIGYHETAEVVKIALEEKKTIIQVILERDIVPEADLKKILDPSSMARPRETDNTLAKKIRNHKGYKKFASGA